MNIKRLDLGLGLGTGTYRVLILFNDRKFLEKFRSGYTSSGLAAESGGGSMKTVNTYHTAKGESVYIIAEEGAALTASARLVRVSVNEDLTDTGVSDVNLPNHGFKSKGEQESDAPRTWDHKLPFFGQKVIDLGYDLPLPYGIGVTLVNIDQ